MRGQLAAACIGLVLLGGPGAAQQSEEPEIRPYQLARNTDYEALVRFRRVQSELIYIDRLKGEIPMDGLALRKPPEPAVERDRDSLTGPELTSRGILLAGLLGLAILVWRNRSWLLLMLGQTSSATPRAASPGNGAKAAPQPIDPTLLGRIRAMADREAAIVLLLQAALQEAAQANGLRLSRSETAREFLRRLPPGWAHGSSLRRLVMAEELVQFGGRALAEDTFEQCLHDAAPILRGAMA